jgi:hypothetical protein
MKVKFYSAEFDIPELMIDKFIKDFDTLAGSGKREEIGILRNSIGSIFEVVAEDPEILHEPEYLSDFIQAMAMKKAMETHGIFYDA